MAQKFKVELVTPKGILLEKEVEEIIAPGIMGEFGVLSGHTPMLTFIIPGIFSYLEKDRFIKFAVGRGFCEVLKDSVTCLVDEAYRAEDIDLQDAEAEKTALDQQIAQVDALTNPSEYERLMMKLKVIKAKIALAGGN